MQITKIQVGDLPTLSQIIYSDVKLSSHSLGLLLTVYVDAIHALDKVLSIAVKEPFDGIDTSLISPVLKAIQTQA